MKKVVGLVVEYNPLHNGHLYHFEESKRLVGADASVIVMSGHFLQRGEPALVDKWARTEMALRMGVDLVFELPYVYATQHAQHFAFGAVSILNKLPFVTHLCFGSEQGDVQPFYDYAQLLLQEPEQLKVQIKQEMKLGRSYPLAFSNAWRKSFPDKANDHFFKQPNNILGLQYVLALQKLNSSIQAATIKREKAGYHDTRFTDQHIASATSIRQALFSTDKPDWDKIKPYLPPFSLEILQREAERGKGPISWDHFSGYLLYSLLSHSNSQLKDIYEIEEGIEYRITEKAKTAAELTEMIEQIKTKRYTWNRIQRMLVHILHQFTKLDAQQLRLENGAAYLRLLGYSKQGQELLNEAKKELQIPLISKIKKEHPAMLDWDLKSSQLYTLGFPKQEAEDRRRELRQPPIFLS